MKRADLTTEHVLASVAEHNECAALFDRYPSKLVIAALEREYSAGHVECGVSLRTCWLTGKGEARLNVRPPA